MEKICFKCNIRKPLTDYYKHKAMGDGYINKCKDCTKVDAKNRTEELSKDNDWKEKERTRGRDKYRRLYAGTGKAKPDIVKKYNLKFPEKLKAKNKSQKMKKPFDGAEAHHWSYNDEHFKDVLWLSKKDHMKSHRFIVYDQERKMYRTHDTNILLDTKEQHEKYIFNCIKNKPD